MLRRSRPDVLGLPSKLCRVKSQCPDRLFLVDTDASDNIKHDLTFDAGRLRLVTLDVAYCDTVSALVHYHKQWLHPLLSTVLTEASRGELSSTHLHVLHPVLDLGALARLRLVSSTRVISKKGAIPGHAQWTILMQQPHDHAASSRDPRHP